MTSQPFSNGLPQSEIEDAERRATIARNESRCVQPSAAVARRVGFVLEGRLRNDSRGADGSLRTTLFFGRVPGDPP